MNELNVYESNAPAKEHGYSTITAAMATTRQAQEVQAAMIVAKKFPRDEQAACDRILNACKRPTLAESATYAYSRGGTEVTGPSIRLAECLAQNWGNIDFGFVELENRGTESVVEAFAWDLETNTRQSKVFTVPHVRHTKKGDYPLNDPRDVYELIANQAARRVRSCILALVPGDVIDAALAQCDQTLKNAAGAPIENLVAQMVEAFAGYGVTTDQLRAYIGKNVEAFNAADVVRLRKVYRAIADGIVGSDYFLDKMKDTPVAPAVVDSEPATVPDDGQIDLSAL